MTKNKQLILISLLVLLLFGCEKDFNKYDRPTWLAGKLYTQILTKPELSTFAELLHVSGYDTIIDVSGSYTVFAPSNDAFTKYFQDHPAYKQVSDIPKSEALKLVKYHLVQNAWSKIQLTTVDVYGWIDTLDLSNNKPRGYKRETLLRERDKLYGVAWSQYKQQGTGLQVQPKRQDIIDTTATSWHRRVFTDSRKSAPIFFKQYFDIYNLSTSDYAFYFGRQFESATDLYYAGCKIVSDEVFSENGFIYVIDRVAEPLKNGAELLTDNSKGNSYSSYYNLVNQFSEFSYNDGETNKQPGASQGLKVDSLFNLVYPQLVFNITSEKTKAPKDGPKDLPSNVTTRYHQGIVAPTNTALKKLENQYLAGGNNWGSIEAAPENIKRIIVNSCMSINPVYLTDLQKGFLNGESDIVKVDESTIVQKEYASNCTFIGVNEPIVPRAFSSVAGPIYTRKGFSKVMLAIEQSGLLSALKRKDANYSFFVEPDELSSIDSSFLYIGRQFGAISLAPQLKGQGFSNTDLRILFMNHIGLDRPKGMARKEFIRNMAGNYIIFNNETKEVRGTAPTTFGYHGVQTVVNIPRQISTNADNGVTYEINNWMDFTYKDLFTELSTNYPKFHNLIRKAGLSQDKLNKYTFISDNQNYTVFAPTDSLINTLNTDALTTAELKNFVMMHFVQGDLIFTDGSKQSGYYETARIDESSTSFTPVNTKIRIETGIDQITIPYKDGSLGVVVYESPKSNIITGKSLGTVTGEAFANSMTNGVIHEIKKPLLFDQVDTK